MKLRKLMAVVAVGMMALTGCGGQEQSQANNTAVETNKEVAEETTPNEETEALRIVSATVAATNVLAQLEAELVGVPTTSSTLPECYDGIDEVGMAMNPDLEKVVALDADLLIVDKNFKESLDASITELGITPFYFNTTTYDNFMTTIEELGAAIGKDTQAAELVDSLKEAEEAVKAKAENTEAPTVAVLFGANSNFMLATETSYIGDLVAKVGGENIAGNLETEAESAYVQFSVEQILEQNPDYVLRFAHGNIEETKAAFDTFFAENPGWDTLDAVKEGRVIDLDPTVFNVSANLSVKDAITELGRIFYGE